MLFKIKLTKGQIKSVCEGNAELFMTAEQVDLIYKKALQVEEDKYKE